MPKNTIPGHKQSIYGLVHDQWLTSFLCLRGFKNISNKFDIVVIVVMHVAGSGP